MLGILALLFVGCGIYMIARKIKRKIKKNKESDNGT
jgi:hypothetical protein